MICAGQALGAKVKEKILEFPSDTSYGNLSKVLFVEPLETHADKRSPLGQARGTVKVPAATIILFQPGPRFFQRPEVVLKLAPDCIDYIKMQFTAMDDNEMTMSDRAVKYIRHLTGLRAVDFDRSDTSDEGVAVLAGMPNLKAVSMTGTTVKGSCLKSLSSCPKLEMIRFGSGKIEDDSLKNLKDFKNLKRLVISRCNLTNDSIQCMAKGAHFSRLDISQNPKVTGAGLKYLVPLKLNYLNLRNTSIAISAVREFAKNQKCLIVMPRMAREYTANERAEIGKIKADIVFDVEQGGGNLDVKTIFGSVNRK